MIDNYKVGGKITSLRREKGFTGERLAELLGVSPQAVSKWENGKNLPETAILPKLAETLGTSIDSILVPQEPFVLNADFQVLGAWYGNADGFRDVMNKMEHYDYFRYKDLYVNHESFPSNPATDAPEYLTLVYQNRSGIHVISCEEGGALAYSADRTELSLKDTSRCMIPGVIPLAWGRGMDCCWGGALYAALKAMGEPFTYEQLMGMSGACYRLNFTEVWDWSATDALVAFDYNETMYRAIGYEMSSADRLDKDDRSAERRLIVSDIQMGKPVVAINLRVAAEWGVITGYADNGKTLYCRTYFDGELLNENGMLKDSSGEYLKTDEWPFLISHFGKKVERPSDAEVLRQSLQTLVTTFSAPHNRGYYQGAESYKKWIGGLRNDALWDERSPKDDFYRRAGVNECTLRSLIDERRCAAVYLAEQGQTELAELYRNVSESAGAFYAKWLDKWDTPDHGAQWRAEEILMLEAALESERRCVEIAKAVLNSDAAPPISPRIVRRGEITVTGLHGDGLQTAEVWGGFDAKYKEKPFTRINSGGWEVRFYDGERPAVTGADVYVGFETPGSAPGDGYAAVTLPASDYVVFDVLVRDGYESRNSAMNTWLADNAGIYAQRMSDGTYYAVERYGERFKGDAPDSVAEIWIPIVRRSMA